MSNIGLGFDPEDEGAPAPEQVPSHQTLPPPPLPRAGGTRRAEKPARRARGRGCLPLLLVLVLIAVGLFFGGGWALDKVKELAGSSPDFSSATGVGDPVTIEVQSGDNAAAIGRTLKAAGVVKSVDAFIDAAGADQRSTGIQVGFYALRKEMKASAALAILVDPKNLVKNAITIPEGFRVKDIVKRIVDRTDFTRAQVNAAMKDPSALGLPPEANGKLEGFLFPATYNVVPGMTAKDLLTQMVTKTKQVEEQLDIKAKAARLGLTPLEVLTVASILEYEGSRDQDYPRIAQAIYNRLEAGMALQSDATVAYANNLSGTVWTTAKERANTSPYNTYVHTGLPPGPIGSPGKKTIEAALNPVKGPWLYWLVVNLRTGETRFNATYDGHLADVKVLREYCKTSDAC